MESVFCSTCLTIYSTGPHHTVDVGRNIVVGGKVCNYIGGFGGVSVLVLEVFCGFMVALVGFKVDGGLKFG